MMLMMRAAMLLVKKVAMLLMKKSAMLIMEKSAMLTMEKSWSSHQTIQLTSMLELQWQLELCKTPSNQEPKAATTRKQVALAMRLAQNVLANQRNPQSQKIPIASTRFARKWKRQPLRSSAETSWTQEFSVLGLLQPQAIRW